MMPPGPASVLGTELAAQVLRGFGRARIRVHGTSMLPSLRPGDEIELQSSSVHEIQIGDVIAYRRAGRLFVHRVVEKNSPQELVTCGDTLPQPDAPICESEVLGLVSAVQRDGKSVNFHTSFAQRSAAALFRCSQLCAAVFLKVVTL
jgi:signal peptidase I